MLLGSDFPSIPSEYAHQLEALERLGPGPEWLRAVCWDNAVRLLVWESAVRRGRCDRYAARAVQLKRG